MKEALKRPEWISVEDDLPDLEQIVLLFEADRLYFGCRTYFDGDGVWFWARSETHYGIEFSNGNWESDNLQVDDYHPTHWIPLPDMPKKSVETLNKSEFMKAIKNNHFNNSINKTNKK